VVHQVHLVLDWDRHGIEVDTLLEELLLALPDASVSLETVAAGAALAAGRRVAHLARSAGPPGRVVAHDVGPRTPQPRTWPPGYEACFCVGRSRAGVLVVGPNVGPAWRPVLAALTTVCVIDVAAGGPPPHPPERLASAIAHVCAGHPHAIKGALRVR
jgi:hypothetical protein